MTSTDNLSPDDLEFLAKCEEEFKDRYTENDEEFMKVFNAETSVPPIIKSWWVPRNTGQRNDRRNNRRYQPYDRYNRDRDFNDRRDHHDRRDHDRRGGHDRRGYNDYNSGYGKRFRQ